MKIIASLSVTGKATIIRSVNTRYVGPISMKIYRHFPKLLLS